MSEYIYVAQKDPERLRAWSLENNVSPKRVGKKLYLSHLQQVFEDNLYHCDLHPGNIVLLRDDRFALIDFGAIASFEKSFLEKYMLMFQAIAERDFTKVVDILLIISPSLPDKDLSDLRAELLREARSWESKTTIKNAPYHEKSLTAAMASLAEIMGKYEVPPAWEFLRLQRAEVTLDSSLALLLPDADYIKLARTYMEKSQRRALKRASSRSSRLQFVSMLGTLLSLPQRVGENLLFDAEWLRKRALSFEGSMTKAAAVGKLLMSSLARLAVTGAVMLVVGYVYRRSHAHPTLLEGTFTGSVVEHIISLRHDVRLFMVFALLYVSALFVRIQRRLSERRPNSPDTNRN